MTCWSLIKSKRQIEESAAKGSPIAKIPGNEDDLLQTADDKVKELYSQLKSGVEMFGTDVKRRPTKKYIAFRRRQGFWVLLF